MGTLQNRVLLQCFGEFIQRLTGCGLYCPRVERNRVGHSANGTLDSLRNLLKLRPKHRQNRLDFAPGFTPGFAQGNIRCESFPKIRIQFFRQCKPFQLLRRQTAPQTFQPQIIALRQLFRNDNLRRTSISLHKVNARRYMCYRVLPIQKFQQRSRMPGRRDRYRHIVDVRFVRSNVQSSVTLCPVIRLDCSTIIGTFILNDIELPKYLTDVLFDDNILFLSQ